MIIQPSFKANPYERNLNKQVSPTSIPKEIKSSPTNITNPSFGSVILGSILVIGLIPVSASVITKIVKKIKAPSEKLVKLISEKKNEITLITENAKESFLSSYKEVTSKSLPKEKQLLAQPKNVSEILTLLTQAKAKEDLINHEENYFSNIERLFGAELNTRKKNVSQYFSPEVLNKLGEQFNKIEEDSLVAINNLSIIPEELKKTKNAEPILKDFTSFVNNNKQTIGVEKMNCLDDFKVLQLANILEDANSSKNPVEVKNKSIKQALLAIYDKVTLFERKSVISQNSNGRSNPNMNIIPSSMSNSILSHSFYRFASDLDAKNYESSVEQFAAQMGENLSLNDIDVLIQRMDIRKKLSNENSTAWFEHKIEELKHAREKVAMYLENSFYNSGANINPEKLNLAVEANIMLGLQAHAKKMGFSTVSRMIDHFAIGDSGESCGLAKDYLQRLENYNKSPISKIYPKINQKLKDNYLSELINLS